MSSDSGAQPRPDLATSPSYEATHILFALPEPWDHYIRPPLVNRTHHLVADAVVTRSLLPFWCLDRISLVVEVALDCSLLDSVVSIRLGERR